MNTRTFNKRLSFLLLSLAAASLSTAAEMKIFDWNGYATESNRGFPHDQPPMENGNWFTPINYAGGTFHIRIEIRSQPVPQNMNIQFCVWQKKDSNRFGLEACTRQVPIVGKPGTVVTTVQEISRMWKKNGKPIEWQRARYRNGIAIKTSSGRPVSDFNGWNWNGQDPKKWYPLDFRYTVVVVAKGSTFSGWDNHIDDSAPPPPPPPPEPEPIPDPEGTLVSNGDFESGMSSWFFYTNGSGKASAYSPGYSGSGNAARVPIDSVGSNMQLMQSGIVLKPSTNYRLTFAAFSYSGNDLRVALSKHTAPYGSYGLRQTRVNLSPGWQTHTVNFTTDGFSEIVADGRLYFWFVKDAKARDRYFIDDVVLTLADANPSPTPEPSPNPTPEPTPDPDPTPDPSPSPTTNVLTNGMFETDLSPWFFYTNGSGEASIAAPGYEGSDGAALVALNRIGTNVQLLQSGLHLQPYTNYELTFAAYSNAGHDLRLALGKHKSPFTNYGLNRFVVDLTTGWKLHTVRFSTKNFSSRVEDGRLYFWFASDARPGDWYFLDQIRLSKSE